MLFSDLVDSTGLATRMDPEDLRELLEAYRGTVDSIVRNRGGCVAQHLGDGVLAFFGYPRADESDVERAVRTGLALVDAVARIGTGERRLQARVGIATGIVVVCSETDTATAGEASATGYPLHLAARLQSLAPAGSVVVADATRRLAPGLFDFHDLGARRLPGFAHPVQAWQARGESRVESRFRALRSPRTELIGRDEEMRCLATAWSAARGRSGGVVLVGGEAWIGKSRLIDSFQREPERDAPLRLRFHCSPHHVSTAFHPVVARFERAARFRRDDSPRTRRDRLETVLAPGTPDADRDLLLELMSVGDGAAGTAAPPDPRQRRQRVLEAMLRQLVLLASRAPVQLYWEDLHWIDPSSRELVDLLVDRAASMPVLLVLTCRPDFRADWTDRAHVTRL
ncbi:MAG TPA: AAA family ATPase, partial [Burkholderiaceae bacterium]|nr:AAA family ATPase [Burkholderiaceae bacterium]